MQKSRRCTLRLRHALANALCLCAFAGLASGQVLETRASATVTTPEILLEDLAVNPAEIPTAWKGRTLGAAPAPGTSSIYSLRTLAAGLEAYQDMSSVWLKGPLKITIYRDGSSTAPACLVEAIEAFAREHVPWTGKEIAAQCDPLKAPFSVPTGAVIRVLAYEPARGNDCFRFEVATEAPGLKQERLTVVARIAVLSKIWVAKHDMIRGQVLTAEDLEMAIPQQGRTGRYVGATENIAGMELNRPIRAGQCLESHFLIAPLCARQGETISVTTESGALRIAMRAKALATGRKDERILCMNETSGRRLMVRLTGTREATAEY
jgi:flagella basal body P-ring formation protein FlgA